jgi:hypothetical protein
VSGQVHDPAASPSGKEPRYPLDRRLDGFQSLWRKEKRNPCLCRESNRSRPARSLVTVLTERSVVEMGKSTLPSAVYSQTLEARNQLMACESDATRDTSSCGTFNVLVSNL